MLNASIKDDLRSFRQSWIHHTGMQLATLTVLVGTLSVVGFVLSFSLNIQRVLSSWGNGAHLTVYLTDDVSDEVVTNLRTQLSGSPEIKSVEYVPREIATTNFKAQMANYAPGLLSDADFANPFPASFRVTMKEGVLSETDVTQLEVFAGQIGKLSGVEDVSFGQSWVSTYSSVVSTLAAAGGMLIAILLAGSIFVVGNSIRASISNRRDEIEILELVGATSATIRRPYIAEGFFMGGLASIVALALNFVLHQWQLSIVSSSVALGRISGQLAYLSPTAVGTFVVLSALLGGCGAWLTIRRLNDGWSASQRTEA